VETSSPESAFKSRLEAYSLSELEDVYAYLDRETFPERHVLIAQEIERRLKNLDVSPELGAEIGGETSPPGFWRRISSSFVDVSIQALAPFIVYTMIQKTFIPSSEPAPGAPGGGRGRGPSPGIWGDITTQYDSVKTFFVNLFAGQPETLAQFEIFCGWALVYLAYRTCWHVFGWTRSGSTPGMKELGLRLERVSGGRPTVKQSVMRFLLHHVLFVVTLGGSGLWMLWDRQKRALHDKLAGTKLVVVKRSWEKASLERQFD
jgi:uncharacterized RDD family membrane protein YckC